MRTFTVNEKEYKARPFDFNLVCDLEDMGISVYTMGRKQFSTTRAYFALCAGISVKAAGKELEAHAIAGGNFAEINIALSDEMEKSDFFQTLLKEVQEAEENQEAVSEEETE